MAKGNDAKKIVTERIKSAFGEDFIDVVDGKIYVTAKENGENLQIAISLTCPKNPVAAGGTPATTGGLDFGGGLDFEAMSGGDPIPSKQAEISQSEKDNIAELMRKLGL